MNGGVGVSGGVIALVTDYVAMRRGLGYRSAVQERALRAFARHLDQAGHRGSIPLEASLDWAASTASTDPCNPARRLAMVRGFLRHLSVIDGQTEVPHRTISRKLTDRPVSGSTVCGLWQVTQSLTSCRDPP